MIDVHDDVLADPGIYREMILARPFQSIGTGEGAFHGIGVLPARGPFTQWFERRYPQFAATVTFARKSHAGQIEPNFIHTDSEMGFVTALLYLNPDPPPGDGTTFWRHKATGTCEGSVWIADGKTPDAWEATQHVDAQFNRAVIFSAPLFHSRGLEANYGDGDDARLIQVLFARVRN